jgi:E3 ubiquitin-protein ligase DMA1/2
MLHGPSWPIFTCPNCRASADLDADVDDPPEEWQQLPEGIMEGKAEGEAAQEKNIPLSSGSHLNSDSHGHDNHGDPGDITMHFDNIPSLQTPAGRSRHPASDPVPIPNASQRRTPSPARNGLSNGHEGLITPRNDAGPWVFDGNPARVSQESARRSAMGSLNAAAQTSSNQI